MPQDRADDQSILIQALSWGNKLLPEPMLTQINAPYGVISHHWVQMALRVPFDGTKPVFS